MTALFHYETEASAIPFDTKTKAFFGFFVIGGLGISVYSLYQLFTSLSLFYVGSLLIGMIIATVYAGLWRITKSYRFHPTVIEVYPSHFYMKKYNDEAQSYQEWHMPLTEIELIIEKHLQAHRGSLYTTPAIHLYHVNQKKSMEHFFDEDATTNQFLLVMKEAQVIIRYLPMSLDYCNRLERIQAFEEEAEIISFTGEISDYVKRNEEIYFYSDRIEYKDILQKKKKNDHDTFC